MFKNHKNWASKSQSNLINRFIQITTSAALVIFAAVESVSVAEEIRRIDDTQVYVKKIVSNIKTPWGMTFLPNCKLLITERDGRLILADINGNKQIVAGVPKVTSRGQGGLLDVEVARDFETTRELFLTYSKIVSGGGTGTALSVAKLSTDGDKLENLRTLFEMSKGSSSSSHFGSRVVEGDDGYLFVTIGDRGDRPSAQELKSHNGSIVRIGRDGSIPTDNPFVNTSGNLPEIWTYGHRNPQGATLDSKGILWIAEHGARGGDEINRIESGLNYGWPIISYGVHYNGRKIGIGFENEGMEQPEFYWDPSIAPAGMTAYSGRLWPQWKDQLFVGSLKFDYISRLSTVDGVREIEQVRFPETKRVRDVQEAPDGTLWFASEDRRAIFMISPASQENESQKCGF